MSRRWIALEPYYGGSHRHLVDGLTEHLAPEIELETWSLPPRKWKWRMRGAAVQLTRRWLAEQDRLADVRGIFTSSLLDAAALRGLLPPPARTLPLILYFHENQLDYPVRVADKRDYHYGWTNIQSALAADRLLWNSAFNRDSFLRALAGFLRRMPDERPRGLGEAIRRKSEILPVPFDARGLELCAARAAPRPERPPRILWNHRWEHDKNPERFFEALLRLADEGLSFEVAVLGQSFERRPKIFERARERLGDRIVVWGYVEGRQAYAAELARCDVAVSTARHEFQGLAVLEAAACGAVPLVPDDLAYREIWPEELRYRRGRLRTELRDRIARIHEWRRYDPRAVARGFDWQALLPRWREVIGN
jgi:glycosyltransferase involved in cell wall biosynthesis